MGVFVRSSIWDYLLCTLASAALGYTACSGFFAAQPLQDPVGTAIIILTCAVLQLALFAVSVSNRSALVGGPVLAVVLVGVLAICVATGTAGGALDDAPGNRFIPALCLIVPCVMVFVLSRRRLACVGLLVLGVLFCALIEYLYWYGHVLAFMCFLVAAAGLVAYRTYQASLVDSESEHLSFASVTASSVGLTLACVLLGVGVFAVVIAPLNPPNLTLKLFTEEYRAQEREVRGIATTDDTPENLYSNVLGDEIVYSSTLSKELENDADDSDTGRGNANVVQVRNSSMSMGSMSDSGGEEGGLGMSWFNWLLVILACALVIAVVLALLVKLFLRRHRYNALVSREAQEAVAGLYLFFMERFARFKMPQPGSMTLNEYANGYESVFCDFEQRASGSSFSELTQVYNRDVFGNGQVGDGECSKFKEYYKNFYRNARHYVGVFRYCRHFFFI